MVYCPRCFAAGRPRFPPCRWRSPVQLTAAFPAPCASGCRRCWAEQVINEDLIHKAVEDERKVAVEERQSVRKGHGASDTVLSEPIELGQIEELALSFKNIVRVDNLVGLHSLTTLRLDNNIISRVENLAHLAPTLTYLDLSFNNIDSVDGARAHGGGQALTARRSSVADVLTGPPPPSRWAAGLEALVNLTDLSLFNNNVSGGLAKLVALSKLQVLVRCRGTCGRPTRSPRQSHTPAPLGPQSVGNNSLSSVEELKCLRKLSSLRALSVEGNPLSDEKGEHKTWIYAFLPQLHYLDWVLIQDEDKRQAREHLQDELQGACRPLHSFPPLYGGTRLTACCAPLSADPQRRRTRRRASAGTRSAARVRRLPLHRTNTHTPVLSCPPGLVAALTALTLPRRHPAPQSGTSSWPSCATPTSS